MAACQAMALTPDNPLAAPSTLLHGLPPLDQIRDEHILPAFTQGLAEQRAAWEAIATDPAPPTFANTVEALERSGRLLSRVMPIHHLRAGNLSDDVVLEQDAEIAPAMAAHGDALHLDQRIFDRVRTLADQLEDQGAEALGLSDEQARLVELTHRRFVLAGAALDDDGREQLASLNHRLSVLGSQFGKALIAGANAAAVLVTDRDDLAGLDDDAVDSARAAAEDAGVDGWLLGMSLFSAQPALSSLEVREVRERVHRASTSRGLGGEHDTTALVSEIAALRARRAALLGFPDHASLAVADQAADDAAAVMQLLTRLAEPAGRMARQESAELEALLHEDGHDGPLQAWDWPYYAARAKARATDLDGAALRPHFPLPAVLEDGVLFAATALYGMRFTRREDLPTHHPDVVMYEVEDDDGTPLGLFMLDPYARPSKRGGAWMATLVAQSRLLGQRPVVSLTMNIPRPAGDGPALLTFDEVETLFHEFGHAVHGLVSDVVHPSVSGTNVPRDVVEFPSQVNEMWALHPDVVSRYARHHVTDEPLDRATVAALGSAQDHGRGFATTEYLAAALLDQAWHRLADGVVVDPEDVEAFEARALAEVGLDVPGIAPRYRSTYFAHAFGWSYDAKYYAYIWSQVMDADLVDWFTERGGLVRDSGERFRRRLLARGNSVDPAEAFAEVRGRAPQIEPLLTRLGMR